MTLDSEVNQSQDFKDHHKTVKFILEHTISTEVMYTYLEQVFNGIQRI